jgi:hypothetical protein
MSAKIQSSPSTTPVTASASARMFSRTPVSASSQIFDDLPCKITSVGWRLQVRRFLQPDPIHSEPHNGQAYTDPAGYSTWSVGELLGHTDADWFKGIHVAKRVQNAILKGPTLWVYKTEDVTPNIGWRESTSLSHAQEHPH